MWPAVARCYQLLPGVISCCQVCPTVVRCDQLLPGVTSCCRDVAVVPPPPPSLLLVPLLHLRHDLLPGALRANDVALVLWWIGGWEWVTELGFIETTAKLNIYF